MGNLINCTDSIVESRATEVEKNKKIKRSKATTKSSSYGTGKNMYFLTSILSQATGLEEPEDMAARAPHTNPHNYYKQVSNGSVKSDDDMMSMKKEVTPRTLQNNLSSRQPIKKGGDYTLERKSKEEIDQVLNKSSKPFPQRLKKVKSRSYYDPNESFKNRSNNFTPQQDKGQQDIHLLKTGPNKKAYTELQNRFIEYETINTVYNKISRRKIEATYDNRVAYGKGSGVDNFDKIKQGTPTSLPPFKPTLEDEHFSTVSRLALKTTNREDETLFEDNLSSKRKYLDQQPVIVEFKGKRSGSSSNRKHYKHKQVNHLSDDSDTERKPRKRLIKSKQGRRNLSLPSYGTETNKNNFACSECEEIYKMVIMTNMPINSFRCMKCNSLINESSVQYYKEHFGKDLETIEQEDTDENEDNEEQDLSSNPNEVNKSDILKFFKFLKFEGEDEDEEEDNFFDFIYDGNGGTWKSSHLKKIPPRDNYLFSKDEARKLYFYLKDVSNPISSSKPKGLGSRSIDEIYVYLDNNGIIKNPDKDYIKKQLKTFCSIVQKQGKRKPEPGPGVQQKSIAPPKEISGDNIRKFYDFLRKNPLNPNKPLTDQGFDSGYIEQFNNLIENDKDKVYKPPGLETILSQGQVRNFTKNLHKYNVKKAKKYEKSKEKEEKSKPKLDETLLSSHYSDPEVEKLNIKNKNNFRKALEMKAKRQQRNNSPSSDDDKKKGNKTLENITLDSDSEPDIKKPKNKSYKLQKDILPVDADNAGGFRNLKNKNNYLSHKDPIHTMPTDSDEKLTDEDEEDRMREYEARRQNLKRIIRGEQANFDIMYPSKKKFSESFNYPEFRDNKGSHGVTSKANPNDGYLAFSKNYFEPKKKNDNYFDNQDRCHKEFMDRKQKKELRELQERQRKFDAEEREKERQHENKKKRELDRLNMLRKLELDRLRDDDRKRDLEEKRKLMEEEAAHKKELERQRREKLREEAERKAFELQLERERMMDQEKMKEIERVAEEKRKELERQIAEEIRRKEKDEKDKLRALEREILEQERRERERRLKEEQDKRDAELLEKQRRLDAERMNREKEKDNELKKLRDEQERLERERAAKEKERLEKEKLEQELERLKREEEERKRKHEDDLRRIHLEKDEEARRAREKALQEEREARMKDLERQTEEERRRREKELEEMERKRQLELERLEREREEERKRREEEMDEDRRRREEELAEKDRLAREREEEEKRKREEEEERRRLAEEERRRRMEKKKESKKEVKPIVDRVKPKKEVLVKEVEKEEEEKRKKYEIEKMNKGINEEDLAKEEEYLNQKADVLERFSFEIDLRNFNEKYHQDVEFAIEVLYANSSNPEDFYTIGHTETVPYTGNNKIEYFEEFEVNFIFERQQYIRIIISSTDGKRSELTINLANVVINRLDPITYPLDLLKGEFLLFDGSKTIKGKQQLDIRFTRKTKGLDKKLPNLLVEFKYNLSGIIAERLRYIIITEDLEGNQNVIHLSNDLMGKIHTPFCFASFKDIKQLRNNKIEKLIFEFWESNDNYVGQVHIDKIEFEKIMNSKTNTTYQVNKDEKPYYSMKQQRLNSNRRKDNAISATKGTSKAKMDDVFKKTSIVDKKKTKENIVGKMNILFEEKRKKKFFDYLSEGMNIAFDLAIDYTSSNKDPKDPRSLHTTKIDNNLYAKAIYGCGNILKEYDSDQLFPVYGFGGFPAGGKEVSHCFNLNNKKDPNVQGIEGVIDCYVESLKGITLVGPTYFAHIIKTITNLAKSDSKKGDFTYHVFMILTDGKVDDMEATREILVECAKHSISLIIVGIGEADFGKMDILDGDDIPVTNPNTGETIIRDNVQFVNFSQLGNDGEQLAVKVLEAVPLQLEEYGRKKGL